MYKRSTPLESLFQSNKITSWQSIPESFGDEFMALDGTTKFTRGIGVRRKYRLPALLDDRQCVVGDMIPPTSWGASLANLLTKPCWDRIRHPLIESVGCVCSICGLPQRTLDIHERWAYYFPVNEMEKVGEQQKGQIIFGIQRLEGFHPVCSSCHRCFHIGLANVNGELSEVKAILKAVNQWSDREVERYIRVVSERARYADQIHWALDVSRVSGYKLSIKPNWYFGEPGQQFLFCDTKLGQSLTLLLNAEWSFSKPRSGTDGIHYLAEQSFIDGNIDQYVRPV